MELKSYDRKDIVVLKEGEPATHVVFVVDGEFQIIKQKIGEDEAQILDFLEDKKDDPN